MNLPSPQPSPLGPFHHKANHMIKFSLLQSQAAKTCNRCYTDICSKVYSRQVSFSPCHFPSNMKHPSNSLFLSLFLYSRKSVTTVKHHTKRAEVKDITDVLGLYIDRTFTSDDPRLLMPNAKSQKQFRGREKNQKTQKNSIQVFP